MGFLTSGDDNADQATQDANNLADEQLQQTQAEAEAKKNSLFQTRLDIVNSQGGQTWAANRASPLAGVAGEAATAAPTTSLSGKSNAQSGVSRVGNDILKVAKSGWL